MRPVTGNRSNEENTNRGNPGNEKFKTTKNSTGKFYELNTERKERTSGTEDTIE